MLEGVSEGDFEEIHFEEGELEPCPCWVGGGLTFVTVCPSLPYLYAAYVVIYQVPENGSNEKTNVSADRHNFQFYFPHFNLIKC